MMKSRLYTYALCGLFLIGCSKKNNDDDGIQDGASLIFGFYAGECSGDCSDVYFLDESSLAVDEDNRFPTNDFFVGNFRGLPQSDFNNSIELLALLPPELLNETDPVLGCPDCADQGGYYLEYQTESFQAAWRIDSNLDEVPSYLHDYIELLLEKMNILPRA